MSYFREVIKRVNKKEYEHEDKKNKSRTGLVKVLSLRNTRASQNDPRLACIMFHKIAAIYRDLKHQNTLQALLAIQNLSLPHLFVTPDISTNRTEPSGQATSSST